jgi:AraC-like DNA-binding protein
MYREGPSEVAGAILWHSTAADAGGVARVLPDGCIDLIWSSSNGLFVAGPDTAAHLAPTAPGETYVGLRLPPGTGPSVVGVPAHELRDRRVPLAAIWAGRLPREIEERIAVTARPGRLLESVAAARLRRAGGADPIDAVVADRLAAGHDIAATAAEVGLSTRQLHRRSQTAFGYGPKTLARILRMRRALALAVSGVAAAEVAARAGYADQAHLSREVKQLAGVPLGTLIRRRS